MIVELVLRHSLGVFATVWALVIVATRTRNPNWRRELKIAILFLGFYLISFRKFFDEDEIGMVLVLAYPAMELFLLIALASTIAKSKSRE